MSLNYNAICPDCKYPFEKTTEWVGETCNVCKARKLVMQVPVTVFPVGYRR